MSDTPDHAAGDQTAGDHTVGGTAPPPPGSPLPGSPPPGSASPGAVPRPPEITYAFWLVLASAVLSIVALLWQLPSGEEMTTEMQRQLAGQGTPVDPAMVSSMVKAITIGGLVGGIVVNALWVFFGVMMRGGRNWARIVLTVLGAVSLGTGLIGALHGGANAPALLDLLLIVVLLVLIYRPASNAYFQVSGPREAPGAAPGP